MTENVNAEAARLCREAAQVIEERGHAKHYYATADGVCLYGALNIAAFGDPHVGLLSTLGNPAYARLRKFFESKFPWTPYQTHPGAQELNDLPETTAQDVQKFLLSAADEIEFQS